jgi:quercetin dioxygenase-like cupin family protein
VSRASRGAAGLETRWTCRHDESPTVSVGSSTSRVDSEVFSLGVGDAVFFEAGVPHEYENSGQQEP